MVPEDEEERRPAVVLRTRQMHARKRARAITPIILDFEGYNSEKALGVMREFDYLTDEVGFDDANEGGIIVGSVPACREYSEETENENDGINKIDDDDGYDKSGSDMSISSESE